MHLSSFCIPLDQTRIFLNMILTFLLMTRIAKSFRMLLCDAISALRQDLSDIDKERPRNVGGFRERRFNDIIIAVKNSILAW